MSDDLLSDEYVTSSDGGAAARGRLYGNLKTQLRWVPDAKATLLNVRQFLETDRGVEIKYKGLINTATGDYRYRAQMRKPFFTNTPTVARIMAAERGLQLKGGGGGDGGAVDGSRLLPGGLKGALWRDWSIAPGVAVSSDKDMGFTYTLAFRKQPQIIKRTGDMDSWFAAKGVLELTPQAQQVSAYGNARLKIFRFGFSTTQDGQVTLGYDWRARPAEGPALASGGDGDEVFAGGLAFSKTPYFKIAENDWAIRWQGRSLSFTYTM